MMPVGSDNVKLGKNGFRRLWTPCVLLFFAAGLGTFLVAESCGSNREPITNADRKTLPPFSVRGGLPHLLAKLKAKKTVHLAFLGGSITQNGGEDGFVSALPEWIRANYPGSLVNVTNAGMAATGSDLGAKRIDRDVLVNNPDLVVVEFAVNDGSRNSVADMERIVRKTLQSNPEAELLFLYTTSDEAFKQTMKGHTPEAIKNHETVARHYEIPSISLGGDLTRRLFSGESKWGNLFHDACHPTAEGYASYNRDISDAFGKILTGGKRRFQQLPNPLVGTGALYPQKLTAKPQQVPAPMRNGTGKKAVETEKMPDLGTEWIRVPWFPSDSPPLWSLRYRIFTGGLPSQYEDGRAEKDWEMARWFGESAGFTGSNSKVLAAATPGGGSTLSVVPHGLGGGADVPEILWTARHTGHYRLVLHVGGISGHAYARPAWGALELATCRDDEINGETFRISMTEDQKPAPLKIVREMDLNAGNQIRFRLLGKGVEYFSLKGIRISIGQFEPHPGE